MSPRSGLGLEVWRFGDLWESRQPPSTSLWPQTPASSPLSPEPCLVPGWGSLGAQTMRSRRCRVVPLPQVPGCLHNSRARRTAGSAFILPGALDLLPLSCWGSASVGNGTKSTAGGFLEAPGLGPPSSSLKQWDHFPPGLQGPRGREVSVGLGCPVHLCCSARTWLPGPSTRGW